MKKISLRVMTADAGLRLDKFLAARSGLSRTACRKTIGEGGVFLGRRRATRLSRPVAAGETYVLVFAARPTLAAEPRVLYEDDGLLAVDKPAGLPTEGTLWSARATALAWAERHAGAPVFSVHRLDAVTSGVLVIAKTHAAARRMAESFRVGAAVKTYLAAVALGAAGLPGADGSIDGRLARAATPGRFEVVRQGGVPATTDWRTLAQGPGAALLAVRPRTGRTHQIRVHLAHLGAPILGDIRYGGPRVLALPAWGNLPLARPLLHASRIELPHPEGGRILQVQAPLPADFVELMRVFGWSPSLADAAS